MTLKLTNTFLLALVKYKKEIKTESKNNPEFYDYINKFIGNLQSKQFETNQDLVNRIKVLLKEMPDTSCVTTNRNILDAIELKMNQNKNKAIEDFKKSIITITEDLIHNAEGEKTKTFLKNLNNNLKKSNDSTKKKILYTNYLIKNFLKTFDYGNNIKNEIDGIINDLEKESGFYDNMIDLYGDLAKSTDLNKYDPNEIRNQGNMERNVEEKNNDNFPRAKQSTEYELIGLKIGRGRSDNYQFIKTIDRLQEFDENKDYISKYFKDRIIKDYNSSDYASNGLAEADLTKIVSYLMGGTDKHLYKARALIDKNGKNKKSIAIEIKENSSSLNFTDLTDIIKEDKLDKFSVLKTALSILYCGHKDHYTYNIMIHESENEKNKIFPIDWTGFNFYRDTNKNKQIESLNKSLQSKNFNNLVSVLKDIVQSIYLDKYACRDNPENKQLTELIATLSENDLITCLEEFTNYNDQINKLLYRGNIDNPKILKNDLAKLKENVAVYRKNLPLITETSIINSLPSNTKKLN